MSETLSHSQSASARSRQLSSLRQFKAILRKDIVMELRTKEMLTSMGLYALLVLVVYFIALQSAGQNFEVRKIAAGLLWLVFIFTSLLGLNRSLVHEKDQGCLDALLISPIDRPVIFFGKAVGNLVFLVIVEVLIVPLFFFIFMAQTGGVSAGQIGLLALALLAGSIGIAGVGTLLATMSVNTKGKDFILAVLFIPIMFPLLLAVVSATSALLMGEVGFEAVYWQRMALAGGYNGIMLLAAFALYEFVLGA